MAIQPNSTIQLFGDLGLKPNMEDTIYFSSESEKNTWFNSKTKLANLSAQTYSRRERNVVRIAPTYGIASIYNAQYMRFINTSYENKWFYAFIISVDYVNDTVVDVKYEIDVMMTWMGDFDLLPCFIERQHVSNDSIGSNTVQENLDVGEHIAEQTIDFSYGDEYKIGVWRTFDPDHDDPINPLKQGTYAPIIVDFYEMSANGISSLQSDLDQMTRDNRIDQVIAMKLVPMVFATTAGTEPHAYEKTISKPYSNFINNNNVPKNKKLYTYPYKYFSIENCENTKVIYRYEYFNNYPPNTNNNDFKLEVRGTCVSPEVSITCVPKNYLNKTYDYSKAVTMTKFLNVPWNVDTYKAYLAQRDSTLFGEMASSGIQGAINGGLAGGGAGAIYGAVGNAIGTAVKKGLLSDIFSQMTGESKYIMPDETRGSMDSDIMIQSRTKEFYCRKMCITPERMRMIDDYFTMFGYAIKKIATPDMNVRTHFTYVKTIGCNIKPKQGVTSIPASDAAEIEDMFNAGKRFWNKDAVVGNYNVTNNIRT